MTSSNTVTPGGGLAGAVLDRALLGDDSWSIPTLEPIRRTAVAHLSDDALMSRHAELAELRQRTDANLAVLADEIARRSHHELGHDGLAQRLGSRTPENLIQRLTGISSREAGALVRVGAMLAEAPSADGLGIGDDAGGHDASGGDGGRDGEEAAAGVTGDAGAPPTTPLSWLRPLSRAVDDARLSIDAADAIGRGLGQPTEAVTPAQLEVAAERLVDESALLTVDQLAVRARQTRALLDLDGEPSLIAEREAALRERRYLYLSRQTDGMTRLSGLLDHESAALVRDAVDAATSPRRDGPRFLDAAEQATDDHNRAFRMLTDPRTAPQLALDAVVELIRLGGGIAPTHVTGVRAPAVQVIVAERDLRAGAGLAFFEGQTEPVTTATAERHLCASGALPVIIDPAGDVVALGREPRRFTRRQRIALAARDGGCRFPGCDRPPSWTEAHHIIPWSHGGSTDLHDGVLLCRHHHLLLHNNGWQFTRVDGALHVIPPPDVDAHQTPIPAPTRSVPLERARAG